jgi:glycosyltransferase involved in cell wall biosynthesis
MNSPRVVAIVPAYNEEQTIAKVLEVLVQSPLLDEVLVVSDGSTDRTVEIAHTFGVRVLDLKENQGKGGALSAAVKKTDQEIVLFVDADLYAFSLQHIEDLVTPVVKGACGMCVGIRDRGPVISRIGRHLPLITGERALKREVFTRVPEKYLTGFMVEPALNFSCNMQGWKIARIIMWNVKIRRKIQKMGMLKGLRGYCTMVFQQVKAYCVVRIAQVFNKF